MHWLTWKTARAAIRQLYNDYKNNYSDSEAAATQAVGTVDEFERAMCMETFEELEDEYERYMRKTPAAFDVPTIKVVAGKSPQILLVSFIPYL